MYYAANVVAGTNTVTVTFDAAVPYPDVRIAEYSGIDAVNAVDVGAEGVGTGTLSDSGSVTTTNANDLLVGANYVTIARDRCRATGYTSRVITSDGSILEDRVVTATRQLQRHRAAHQWQLDHADGGVPRGDRRWRRRHDCADSADQSHWRQRSPASQINLSWTASTDNVGVTGYQIERCTGAGCSNFALLTTVTTTSYNNTGLAASTTYRYRVRAGDAAGNLSSYSAIASATTQAGPVAQPPTVSISSPSGGATLTGTVTLVCDSDGPGQRRCRSPVPGRRHYQLARPIPQRHTPFNFATAQMANGAHSITAYAWDRPAKRRHQHARRRDIFQRRVPPIRRRQVSGADSSSSRS